MRIDKVGQVILHGSHAETVKPTKLEWVLGYTATSILLIGFAFLVGAAIANWPGDRIWVIAITFGIILLDREIRNGIRNIIVSLIVIVVIVGLLAALVLFAISSVPAAILTAALIILYGMYRFRR